MVDLLLVRLTREEEKNKVLELLVSELGMSREEARDKVDSSPVILRENVQMEQGRILQDRMYPFVDLLPKYYSTPVKKKESPEGSPAESSSEDPPKEETQDISSDIVQGSERFQNDVYDPKSEPDVAGEDDDDIEIDHGYDSSSSSYDEDDDDSMIITSAAEEVLQVERCHICGRTPTDSEKLVPCRTCAELTCAGCYNRMEHVCDRCAAQGRTADRPLDSVPEEMAGPQKEAHPAAESRTAASASGKDGRGREKPPRGGGSRKVSPVLFIALAIAVLGAAFYFIDPLNMFSKVQEDDTNTGGPVPVDTIPAAVEDTVAVVEPDTVAGPPDSSSAVSDTLEVQPDSTAVDTLPPPPAVFLSSVALPDSLVPQGTAVVPRGITRSPVASVFVLEDSMSYLEEPLASLAAFYSVELDGFSLVRTESGHDILLMSILHPEPSEKRAAYIGTLGSMLDSTMVDQIIVYYRENQYYDANMFSFTADSFSVLSVSNSPTFLQRRQALIPETTALVTGALFQWMTEPI